MMLMESDPNPLPKFELFKPLDRVGKLVHFVFDHIRHEGISDHANRGGGPALDRALDEQQIVYHSTMGDTSMPASRYKQIQ